jgi:hypothetical protein
MSRGLGELPREIKDALTFLWNHKQTTQFANIRAVVLIRHGGEGGDTMESTYERSMRRALKGLLDGGDVVIFDGKGGPGDPHRYANVEDFASLYVRKGRKVRDATHAKEILLKVNAEAAKVRAALVSA